MRIVSRMAKRHATPGTRANQSESFYLTVRRAAQLLGCTEVALRARLRRYAASEADEVVARLGDGIVGFKFGGLWRVRFPPAGRSP